MRPLASLFPLVLACLLCLTSLHAWAAPTPAGGAGNEVGLGAAPASATLAAVPLSASALPHSARPGAHRQPRLPSDSATTIAGPSAQTKEDEAGSIKPATPLASTPDDACRSCCDGGSCSYAVAASSGPEQMSLVKSVQCCGKLNNQPRCCAAYRPTFGEHSQCGVDASGYVCRDVRSQFRMLSDAAYLSRGALAVIIICGSLIVLCYVLLGTRRSRARYYGEPAYYGHSGGGAGVGTICAACLAGFCCTELCCPGGGFII